MGDEMTLDAIFSGIDRARVGVIGDFCLDVYWLADMTRSELSRETPHFPLPVVQESMSPGAAGNVAANIAALRPASLLLFGALGDDWRGHALRTLLTGLGADTSGLLTVPDRVTNAFCKPLRRGIADVVYEDPRLDFENDAQLPQEAQERLVAALRAARLDVLCVCDQVAMGCVGETVRRAVCDMGREGMTVLVDSRDRVGLYRDVIIKPNEVEAARALGQEADFAAMARRLSEKTGKPALITLGDRGCMVCEAGAVTAVPARPVTPPLDICGAGDSFLSGLACALAAGASLAQAALFANTASAVTVQKLHTTGTASREEIREKWN